MAKLVTIFGGSGFIGRYVAQQLAENGWRVRVAVRRPNEAGHVRASGSVGQVEPIFANIRDDDSVRSALAGSDAVVNCVGTFDAGGRNNFSAVHIEGAGRIARISAELGVDRMVHISALGADPHGDSEYQRSKAAGEVAVLQFQPKAMILRPSVVFGTEDGFFNRFAGMARMGPVLPITGGETKFQPVYVVDVATAAVKGVEAPIAGIFELGGPDVDTLNGWMGRMLNVINRSRIILNLPFGASALMAFGFDMLQAVTLGLFTNNILTRDQVRSLRSDNLVADGAHTFTDLGISATTVESVLPEYLWRFRPSGQYDAIKASAKNLKA